MTFGDGAGQVPGIEAWRIEQLVPVPVPKELLGQFYDGDAYIVLKTTKKLTSSAFTWDLFFWLGENCSQDEAGTTAFKTVELDEALGGAPVQSREVQGSESDAFMQCFRSVQYLKGGVASGFKMVQRDAYETRLLHLKGARMVRVSTVPLSASSLNSGDVFILDAGLTLFQWNGSEANRKEKAKALEISAAIKDDERGGKARIIVCDHGAEPDEFWSALGGRGPVAPATADEDSKIEKSSPQLVKLSDASGSLTVTDVASGDLKREMLSSDDVYIVDNGAATYVWVGKGASIEERKKAITYGTKFCDDKGRGRGAKITKVLEGSEPQMFKSNFVAWLMPQAMDAPMAGNIAASRKDTDASELASSMKVLSTKGGDYESAYREEQQAMLNSPKGEVEVWRIEGFEKVKLEDELEGQFFAGDSYVVLNTYEESNKKVYMLYIWLGSDSSSDEMGAAALIAINMDDELGGAATQVRVSMGKEPFHFVKLFDGKMIVHSGGKASAYHNRKDTDSYDTDGVSLYHVRGTSGIDTRAVQVGETASSLNSGDCFVLLTPQVMYLWYGSGSNTDERDIADKIAGVLQGSRTLEAVLEGSEPEAFWEAMGGKAAYPTTKVLLELARDPMLFHCSNATGVTVVEPIFDFGQADLEEEDVYIVDSYTTIWVWVGTYANEVEKTKALESAAEYVKVQGYGEGVPVSQVRAGAEPLVFTSLFLGWEPRAVKVFVDPYQAKLDAIKAANPPEEKEEEKEEEKAEEKAEEKVEEKEALAKKEVAPKVEAGGAAEKTVKDTPSAAVTPAAPLERAKGSVGSDAIFAQTFAEPGGEYRFNYEALTKPVGELPKGVDPRNKEAYLRDEDFERVLKSPREEFVKLKPWKQQALKKAAGLF